LERIAVANWRVHRCKERAALPRDDTNSSWNASAAITWARKGLILREGCAAIQQCCACWLQENRAGGRASPRLKNGDRQSLKIAKPACAC
jgi:hypothetical protein